MGLQQKRGYISLVIIFSLAMAAAIEAAQPPFACNSSNPSTKKLTFCSTELPIKQRAEDLVSRLTLDEKVSQLVNDAPAIPRLGIPAYQWWSESLHGVADAGLGVSFEGTIHAATSFPQVILTAASFDAHLWYRIGQAIGKEARAVYNQGQAQGMTFWAPNINIFRDPRWGRGQETPGEDPLVTGRYGVSYVRGVQGDSFEGGGQLVNEGHLQASACCKHMTAYDLDRWDNITRYIFDAHPSPPFTVANCRMIHDFGYPVIASSFDGAGALPEYPVVKVSSIKDTTLAMDLLGVKDYYVRVLRPRCLKLRLKTALANMDTIAAEVEAAATATAQPANSIVFTLLGWLSFFWIYAQSIHMHSLLLNHTTEEACCHEEAFAKEVVVLWAAVVVEAVQGEALTVKAAWNLVRATAAEGGLGNKSKALTKVEGWAANFEKVLNVAPQAQIIIPNLDCSR
ncbi:hypothetical protein Nepgr_024415 [Nepenthes gracilis]|uniref:Glycoside hydrolase family 3 N-terminal domain-containing protein n=1 Tax=Nepenthes gracilis TaxID=150966 RepID=A0AAD3XYK7_NEPGR|nr:hypothetical protein Nepgr_024415 [Nepenthes gracilis]